MAGKAAIIRRHCYARQTSSALAIESPTVLQRCPIDPQSLHTPESFTRRNCRFVVSAGRPQIGVTSAQRWVGQQVTHFRAEDGVGHPLGKSMDMPALASHPSLLSTAKFCEESGLSPEALEKALVAKRLFAVQSRGQTYIPDFFLDERYDRRHLHSVCKALGDLPGGSKLQFFTTPKGSLGGQTPLDALLEKRLSAVRRSAQGFVER